jgi:hypothetical protein
VCLEFNTVKQWSREKVEYVLSMEYTVPTDEQLQGIRDEVLGPVQRVRRVLFKLKSKTFASGRCTHSKEKNRAMCRA